MDPVIGAERSAGVPGRSPRQAGSRELTLISRGGHVTCAGRSETADSERERNEGGDAEQGKPFFPGIQEDRLLRHGQRITLKSNSPVDPGQPSRHPVISIRSRNNDLTGGTYRREMAQQFNDGVYPGRQIMGNTSCPEQKVRQRSVKPGDFCFRLKKLLTT